MTSVALALVLTAAFAHAGWNFFTKKANGGVPFIWLFAAVASVAYLPVAVGVLLVQKPSMGVPQIGFIFLAACLHSVYFYLLDRGYRLADLSVVYPLARGTGPLISALIGVIFLNERPSVLAGTGAGLMALGILALTGNPLKLGSHDARRGIGFALLCGLSIAAYTVSDKVAVSRFGVPPLLLD